MRRILLLITSLGHGGAETQVVELARGLAQTGWGVQVVCMTPLGPKAQDLAQAGIPVDSLGMRPGRPSLKGFVRMVRLVREFQPQVLHAHMVHANLLARLVRPLVRVPVVLCTAHNIIEGGRWRELAYRLTDPLCDLTTQVSQAGLERYLKVGAIPKGRGLYIPNGVDTRRFAPDPEARLALRREMGVQEEFIWLAVGRFAPAKDYPNLLQAFREVSQAHPAARLWLVGQGPLLEPMKGLAQSMGLEDKVRFLGARGDVPGLMNAADAYVMSSAWEGMPMVLLEAAAVGLPIVATDVGGNREVVEQGENGLLVSPKDSSRLAMAMRALMERPAEERTRMGQAGRALVLQRYDLQRIIQRWEDLYQELLSQKTLKPIGER
ncbi:GDP-mannose-dependent alpha-(1-6)-phosphatidylinositol monomannoside mannosyltransferase [Meiothermus luteus]|jgi:glycosyltransferase involved in cell wall biosynthesis|uniref:GDP-mannose-dependent alpha-(1-6)-phosphatidylinositol monomannoside mannosyltransferase n=1 Tax=Meiothermus luteus TaxID=2026184 RepID=A0A399F107_9DEIN|nr:glycosyltransferase [Meiothermus luteus]RIH89743.1 GDP-mannose-dependent alpha-(1-6)-phosphatidylinositol monomannoside mannosyltransferase [Meiothermus luteus]RMH57810.1 MAG: glycosyltransferase [Deinococcota bacterium]